MATRKKPSNVTPIKKPAKKAAAAPPPAPALALTDFEGDPVVQSRVKVTRAGDGLSSALAVEPRKWHRGDRVTLILDAEVTEVNHKGLTKDTPDVLVRVHTLVAGTCTIVDAGNEVIDALLEAQRVKVEEHQGVHRIPVVDPEEPATIPVGTADDDDWN